MHSLVREEEDSIPFAVNNFLGGGGVLPPCGPWTITSNRLPNSKYDIAKIPPPTYAQTLYFI
jgi:hypothetical protein